MTAQRIQNPVSGRPQKRLYNVNEAAVYLGRSAWALREMYYQGKVPTVKDGRRILFDIQDLDAWIEAHKKILVY
jgi:excisionase family DNA binding protein